MNRMLCIGAACVVVGLAVGLGCAGAGRDASTASTSGDPAITIDRSNNGAAGGTNITLTQTAAPKDQPPPRTLAFEMTGVAPQPEGAATMDARAAGTQAAIIDAFCKAVIEARRSRGQSASNFTAEMGPRLSLTHRIHDGHAEIQAALITAGSQTVFNVVDGRLTHPAHDLKMVERLFQATNGEFELLSTNWSSETQRCVASVACYRPAMMDSVYAGDASAETIGESGEE